jgi:penicillin V acylase-like amidase (Ntn superfamily)
MCTSSAGDETMLVGRTMEYSLDANWELRAVSRGVAWRGVAWRGPDE